MGDRQIAQMCKFIKQEAKEKANEIAIKTNHDFNKEKQLKVKPDRDPEIKKGCKKVKPEYTE